MSPCSNSQSGKPGNANQESATNTVCNLPNYYKSSVEHEQDEDEEEDVDFNPLFKDSSSAEASSSISSEVEGLDVDVVDSVYDNAQAFGANFTRDGEGDGLHSASSLEEMTGQIDISSQGRGDLQLENVIDLEPEKRKSDLIPQLENDTVIERNTATGGAHASNDFPEEEMNMTSSRMLCNPLDDDDDDAICKRTRARYSLTSFSLDELEAFLQETDDDEDLPDVDDEEEYRKFLAAVFNNGNEDGDLATVNHANDEDEDNDADFELELEEALESDIINCVPDLNQKNSKNAAVRRPETRRNKRQISSSDIKDKVPKFVRKPLRPLVLFFPGATIATLPGYNGRHSLLQTSQNLPSWSNQYSANSFTPDQMAQLYCLVHEHVQLLIQIYSLSVLEPSRKSIASQAQGLLSEMIKKRDEALTSRKVPHPTFFFGSPDSTNWQQFQENATGPSQTHDSQSSADPQGCTLSHDQPSKASSVQVLQCSRWFPYLDGPILSILDVAPLKLVGKYIEGVTTAVQEQMRRYVEPTCDLNPEKQPLFPLLCCPSQVVSNPEIAKTTGSREYGGVPSSLSNHGAPKKTLAATIVESAKKESIALVPKKIAELAMQFFPLLNPALFPHKPPPLSVANRVLFTDSEDELLAMGLMEYNTDWKAIQQRYLPCKSKHQIFVRQKNRCSSKAPENPIKSVRRLKTSPLTTEEIARISEGLKMFKLDWMSICNFIVPYRDPSLLPRQWRIALGTQKSYKQDPSKREKRRLYEWQRRQSKRFAMIESGDSGMEKDNEVYAHELFLSDSRPVPAIPSTELSTSCLQRGEPNIGEPESLDRGYNKLDSFAQGSRLWETGRASPMENLSATEPDSRCKPIHRPYMSRHTQTSHMVKLAPGLPPVNLPPSVRVISEAAFRNPQQRPPSGTENIISPCHVGNASNSRNMSERKNSFQNHGNSSRSDILMHPSQSEVPGNRHAPCHRLTDDNIGPSSFDLRLVSSRQKSVSPKSGRSRKVLLGVNHCEPSGNAITGRGAVNEVEFESNRLSVSIEEKDSTIDDRQVLPSNDEHGCAMAAVRDLPMLDIIMEQEELSDSDEEMEHVEFECEEMADSDSDDVESKSGSILNNLDKEHRDTTNIDTDYSDQLNGSDRCENSRLLDYPGFRETGGSQLCLRQDDEVSNGIAAVMDSGGKDGVLASQSSESLRESFGNKYDNNNVISTQNKSDVPRRNKDSVEVATSSSRIRRKRVIRHPLEPS